jgi:hypothetical protein
MPAVPSTIMMKDGDGKDPSVAASSRHQALRVVREARCLRKTGSPASTPEAFRGPVVTVPRATMLGKLPGKILNWNFDLRGGGSLGSGIKQIWRPR